MEKDRNMKIFDLMQRRKELGSSVTNEAKLTKLSKKKHDKAHKYAK
jgi:hypothetical protein